MSASKQALEFVKYILDQICETKEAIELNQTKDEMGVLISIKVAESDMGKLIGKQGQTISAIRTLVRIMGARENERINLKVLEPSK
ncbi:KH domain-containing protein [Candidatus Gracilibacteria bacterium]|nr:KH domain-containing protein [Candidatus Gracilibacteria bacterium]